MKASKVFFTSELFYYFVLRVNISVSPESSGEEPMNKAAAEGALPGAMSYRNSCQEPKELAFLKTLRTARDRQEPAGRSRRPQARAVNRDVLLPPETPGEATGPREDSQAAAWRKEVTPVTEVQVGPVSSGVGNAEKGRSNLCRNIKKLPEHQTAKPTTPEKKHLSGHNTSSLQFVPDDGFPLGPGTRHPDICWTEIGTPLNESDHSWGKFHFDWTDIKKFALKGDPKGIAMPVTYDAHDANPKWERLDREVVRDLMKAVRDNGLGSPYFKQLLKGTFSIYDLTPFDLRSLATMILSDSQFILWEAKWRKILNDYRIKYQGGANAGFTVAQLAGDPPLDSAARQASFLPRDVLTDIKDAARKAMVQIPPAGVTESLFTDVKQGPSEPFASFIDRLTQAVDRQVIDEGVKSHLIRCLAFANANPECKRVISAVPGQPTMAEILEACSKTHLIIVRHVGEGSVVLQETMQVEELSRETPEGAWIINADDTSDADHNDELTVLAKPHQPPLIIPPNTSIARAIALPPHAAEQALPVLREQDPPSGEHMEVHASWVKHIGRDRPILVCELTQGDKTIAVKGMLDMGADVTSEDAIVVSGPGGFLAEGNEHADKLTMPISRTLPNIFEQAKLSHAFFHQNAQALMDTFHISRSQAKEIISACPDCQLVQPPTSMGAVNPRGLHSLQLWRTDVTKYPSFGKLKNVHVSVDTFSGAVFASLHTGETAQHACRHFLQAFASLGVPQEIKTDNGPTYIGKVLDKFLKRWGVHHTFGIPHPPTGQAIIERTHQTLKSLLDRQKRGEADATPYMRLNKALYVLNFLNCSFAEPTPPIIRHFSNITRAKLKENPLVLVRNPETGQIEGPFKLITWGKGYACVSTAAGPKWLAARHVKPYRVQTQAETDPKTGGREVGTQT
ncbi:hypothetical protein DUI87_31234 [Hirundo rustica rustica]|uniref:RNA-directed DNA polymerase n=1 Tax=Hirundo rustica rustica TaxID=333673 RepID=A0A3M0J0Q6_HIRRU|nr:hypothetical protein DUI87_31234 [Hirundo rustica rustica]